MLDLLRIWTWHMPALYFRVGWLVIGLAALAWETLALLDPDHGGTLTEQVRWIVSHPFAWWIGAGFFVWLFGHFFFGWQ